MRNQFTLGLAIFCCLIAFCVADCVSCTPPYELDWDGLCSECLDGCPSKSTQSWLLGVIVGVPSGIGVFGLVAYKVRAQMLARARIHPTPGSSRRFKKVREQTPVSISSAPTSPVQQDLALENAD